MIKQICEAWDLLKGLMLLAGGMLIGALLTLVIVLIKEMK